MKRNQLCDQIIKACVTRVRKPKRLWITLNFVNPTELLIVNEVRDELNLQLDFSS